MTEFRKANFATFLAGTVALMLVLTTVANAQKKKKNQKNDLVLPVPTELKSTPPPPPPPANGSLFTPGAPGVGLVGDFKARSVGDLVFVEVVETSAATVSSNASRNRDSGTIGGLVGATGAIPVSGASVVSGVMEGMGARKYDGKGSTQRQSDLKASIAARVTEVLPNGDLRIQAEKLVKINKEDERLQLTGIVRSRDLSAENTVASTFVGELAVSLNGKGVASADNAPGWLFRFIDKISPF